MLKKDWQILNTYAIAFVLDCSNALNTFFRRNPTVPAMGTLCPKRAIEEENQAHWRDLP